MKLHPEVFLQRHLLITHLTSSCKKHFPNRYEMFSLQSGFFESRSLFLCLKIFLMLNSSYCSPEDMRLSKAALLWQRCGFMVNCSNVHTSKSPEMLAPARMPVAAGKKMANTEKKPSSPLNSGPKFSANMDAANKQTRKGKMWTFQVSEMPEISIIVTGFIFFSLSSIDSFTKIHSRG